MGSGRGTQDELFLETSYLLPLQENKKTQMFLWLFLFPGENPRMDCIAFKMLTHKRPEQILALK